MDEWMKWALIALFAFSSVSEINKIGKERRPISPGEAAFVVLVNIALIGIVLWSIVTSG